MNIRKPDPGGGTSVEISADVLSLIQAEYQAALPRHEALLDEVTFILRERLRSSEIKVHGVEQRVKAPESVLDKCKQKGISTLSDLEDVVGARVICLFRSDLERVGNMIRENFDVMEVDDKLSGENAALGYLSVHYSCKMPARYSGPRYESTSDLPFEIQVRTLCMHAWAAVSHYLDYKGEWDVPANLKQALSALSGLFFVADNEFEQFYAARLNSKKAAEKTVDDSVAEEINLDTVSAYLDTKYPDRDSVSPEIISMFVQELKLAGYKSIKEVDLDIDRGATAFGEFEKKHVLETGGYAAVGAARLSLSLASDAFNKASTRFQRVERLKMADPILPFRHLVRGPI